MKQLLYPVIVFSLLFTQSESSASNAACQGCRILTPAIKAGNVSQARLNAKVPSEQFAGLESYSGFITVNEEYDSNLFFWFFPGLDKKPVASTSWMVWLQGGPGYSSMYALFDMVGPIKIEKGQVLRRIVTLTAKYPVLFIDNPVGAGYSFTRNENGYPTNQDDVGDQLLEFLKQFLEMFPELKSAPLFLAGESYAGKYIPTLGMKIHRYNVEADLEKQVDLPLDINKHIDLRGMIMGGAMINPVLMMEYSRLVTALGMLDEAQAEELRVIERAAVEYVQENKMVDAANKFNETIEFIKKHSLVSVYNFIQDPTPITKAPDFEAFIQRREVRRSIGAGDAKFDLNNQLVYGKMLPDIMKSTQPLVEELLNHYPVLCYHGQNDVIMAYSLARNTYKSLRWNGWIDYHLSNRTYLKDVKGRFYAYINSGGGFTDMLVRNAGHLLPADTPEIAVYIHYNFIEKHDKKIK